MAEITGDVIGVVTKDNNAILTGVDFVSEVEVSLKVIAVKMAVIA